MPVAVVGTEAAHRLEALSSVIADDHVAVALEEAVGVGRVDRHAAEVERPPDHPLAVVAPLPGLAAVGGAIQRRILRLDEGVDDVVVARRDHDFRPAPRLGRRRQLFPVGAAVGRFEQRAAARRVGAVAAGAEGPALAAEVPQAGVEDIRVGRVHRQRRAARREVSAGEDQVPALAAVGRLVEAAVGAVAPERTRRAGVHGVAVLRVDDDAGDPFRLGQPDVGPGLAAVGRLVDAVADGDRVARPALA